ncbi:MAG TPA: aldose 1-epimerase [Myxococcaceae bacterium]|nr:aldose 1-epimerase [Myxococcaceae bacterium]
MIGERQIDGFEGLTLSFGGDELEAAFVPAAGMVGCSLRHRGEELLGQRGGLARYVADRSTMGIPLLHPWANRVAVRRFSVAGRDVDLWAHPGLYTLGPKGLPIHGLLAAAPGWSVERHEDTPDGARLAASFDFAADEERMTVFPFPHQLRIEATITDRTLTIATTVWATGAVPVPISFGYHPYFRLPNVERNTWAVEIPVTERVVLDSEELPTGEREAAEVPAGPLGSRTFDDEFVAPAEPFVLEGGGRRIEISFGQGYPFAQVYAPDDDDVIAFEPMTAPTNALVSGRDLQLLEPGESYEASFSITVTAG